MFKKFYLAVGIFLCIGLGTAFALDWKAPNLGIADSFSGSGGRSGGGFFYFGGMGGGGGFGK